MKLRIFVFALSVMTLLTFLFACAVPEKPVGEEEGSSTSDALPKDCFKTSWQTLSPPQGETGNEVHMSGEAIYFSTQNEEEYHLYSIAANETIARLLYSTSNWMRFSVAPDGVIWTVESETVSTEHEEDFIPLCDIYFKKVSVDGAVLEEKCMVKDTYPMGCVIQVSRTGVPYYVLEDTVYWLPEGGFDNLQQLKMSEGRSYEQLYSLNDGYMAACVYDDTTGQATLCYMDEQTGEALDEVDGDREWNWDALYSGSGRYVLIEQKDDVLWGYTDDGKWESIVDLAAYELGFYSGEYTSGFYFGGIYTDICAHANGEVLLLEPGWDICRLTPCTANETAKTVIVAGWSIDDKVSMARAFNKTQSDYIVRVKDYARGLTDAGSGLMKLNAELMAGDVPDVLCVSNYLAARALVARHGAEDLRPYIEKDPEMGTDWFIDGILDQFTTDGGIYQLGATFSIDTMLADPETVGSGIGLTFARLEALEAAYPDTPAFFPEFTRDKCMSFIETACVSDFVNWKDGACDFQNDGFTHLLTMAASRPTYKEVMDSWAHGGGITGTSEQQLKNGKILLSQLTMSGMWQYCRQQTVFDGKVAYVGFPTATGRGSVLYSNDRFSIMRKATHKDGAWMFIKWIIMNENAALDPSDMYANFPVSRAAFEECVGYYQNEAAERPLSFADVEQLKDLIRNAHTSLDYDKEIADIIEEEAEKYFRNKCTAEQAAAAIQSRVSIYVSEQS